MKDLAVILAAGRGTRMHSELIKVLHPVLGQPMVAWPIQAARAVGLQPVLVVGHQEDQVRAAFENSDVRFARQPVPRGTGDAVRCALEALPEHGRMVVMAGDAPLFQADTLKQLLEIHGDAKVTVLTAIIDEPAAYGRLIRSPDGTPLRIVEASEASPEELAVQEINTGVYVFDIAWLRSVLPSFVPHPPKNEIYLTDAVERAAQDGAVQAVILADPSEADGVNDRWALTQVCQRLQQRIIKAHALNGVGFEDPSSNTVEVGVQLEAESYIERGAILRGQSKVAAYARVGAYSIVEDSELAQGVYIKAHSHLESTVVGETSVVGPYARLRAGTVLQADVKIGNFVETKKAHFAHGAKASHLSYIGDASVGSEANIGAGTITCNYDGFSKFQTNIGAGAFIGSNTALVAPVDIGEGALVAAGSTITQPIPSDAIGITRAEQRCIEGGAARFRAKRNHGGTGVQSTTKGKA